MLLSETNHLLCSIFSHIHSHLETPSPLPASPLDGKCDEKFPFLLTLPLYLWTWLGGHGSPSVFHSASSPSSLLLLLGTRWKDIFWFVIDNHAARHLLEGNLFFPDVVPANMAVFLHLGAQELKRSIDEQLGSAETKRPTITILSLHLQGQLMLVMIIHNQKII